MKHGGLLLLYGSIKYVPFKVKLWGGLCAIDLLFSLKPMGFPLLKTQVMLSDFFKVADCFPFHHLDNPKLRSPDNNYAAGDEIHVRM